MIARKLVRMQSNSDLLTKREVARFLGCSISFVNCLLSRRKLPKIRLSYKVVRIPRDSLEAFIRSRREASR
jgi:excisionase family DNA binding protein